MKNENKPTSTQNWKKPEEKGKCVCTKEKHCPDCTCEKPGSCDTCTKKKNTW